MPRITAALVAIMLSAFIPQEKAATDGLSSATYYVGHKTKYVNITFESDMDLETIVGTTHAAAGQIDVNKTDGTGAVSLTIPVKSLDTGIELRNTHLQSADWLDAAKFPDLTFKSKKVEKVEGKADQVRVTGDFTMHGFSKEVVATVEWKELPEDLTKKNHFPEGKWIKFATQFSVKLSDFGVKIPAMAAAEVSDTWNVKMAIFAGTGKPENK